MLWNGCLIFSWEGATSLLFRELLLLRNIDRFMKNKQENYSSKEGLQNSSTLSKEEKIDVRAKLAETAGVSTDTYSKGKKILDSNNEILKQEVLSGEKSINAGYKEL